MFQWFPILGGWLINENLKHDQHIVIIKEAPLQYIQPIHSSSKKEESANTFQLGTCT